MCIAFEGLDASNRSGVIEELPELAPGDLATTYSVPLSIELQHMPEEQTIRELCAKALSASDADLDDVLGALHSVLKQHLEDNSDELVPAELLRMPHVAANGTRAA